MRTSRARIGTSLHDTRTWFAKRRAARQTFPRAGVRRSRSLPSIPSTASRCMRAKVSPTAAPPRRRGWTAESDCGLCRNVATSGCPSSALPVRPTSARNFAPCWPHRRGADMQLGCEDGAERQRIRKDATEVENNKELKETKAPALRGAPPREARERGRVCADRGDRGGGARVGQAKGGRWRGRGGGQGGGRGTG